MTAAERPRFDPAPLLNLAAMVALAIAALMPLAGTFQSSRFWIAAVGGVLLGAGVAYLGSWLRIGAIEVAALTIATYFLFGGALALRSTAIAGTVPSLTTLRDLALTVVFGWKQLLTLSTPVDGFEQLLAVPYLAGLVATVLAGGFALRLRRHWIALVPVGALFAFAIAFGDAQTALSAPTGAALAVLALVWLAWRRHLGRIRDGHVEQSGDPTEARKALLRRVGIGGLTLLLAGGIAVAGGSLIADGSSRALLREHVVPPLELHDYASPLMSFRKLVEDGADSELFTVTGLPSGAVIRLATMDLYDGIVYKVSGKGGSGSGVFSRIGRTVTNNHEGTPVSLRVEVKDLPGVWLPDVGYLSGIEFGGARAEELSAGLHYNRATGTAVTAAGISEGDSYSLTAVLPATPSESELAKAKIADLATPAPELVPDPLQNRVDEAVKDAGSNPIDQARAIETYLKGKGYFSHGLEGESPSRPGHALERLTTMLGNEQMIGDQEQYAVVMGLMLAQSGIPSRVVMGFAPKSSDPNSTVTVTGADVSAWVEVPTEGFGWVAFHPTPNEDQKPTQETPQQRQKPIAQVPQPPLPPQQPAELPPDPPVEDKAEEELKPEDNTLWRYLAIGGMSLGGVALVLAPGLVMAGYRARRRRRRREAEFAPDQVSGGWAEIIDAATDSGVVVPAVSTRRENGALLSALYPDLAMTQLAARADQAVFNLGEPSADEVAAYWADVETARTRVAAQARFGKKVRRFFAPPSVVRGFRLPRWLPGGGHRT